MSPVRIDSAKVLTLLFIFISYTKCNVNNEQASDGRKLLPKGEKLDGWLLENFIIRDSLADGERQLRIHMDGIIGKETSAGHNSSRIVLRQLTDGRHFLQTILTGDGDLIDCEYVQKKGAVKKFIKGFYSELLYHPNLIRQREDKYVCEYDAEGKTIAKCKRKPNESKEYQLEESSFLRPSYRHLYKKRDARKQSLESLRNVTVEMIESSSQLPGSVSEWLNFSGMKQKCDLIHKQIKMNSGMEVEDRQNYRRPRRSQQQGLAILPGTMWCGAGQLAETYAELGPLSETDVCCRQHDHCPSKVAALSRHAGLFNTRGYTIVNCACDSRRVSRSTFLMPGTRWCGKGNTGIMNDLGEFGEADRCCRKHDNSCPIWIESMETKYGYFHWGPGTIMHCRCDERFRACLKRANTDVSNMVGKLFFNVMQTKCFVLKPVKGCVEHSWWGKCLKMGMIKQARLRDNISY